MRKIAFPLFLFLLLFLFSSFSLAAVPTQINFQGVLETSSGVPASGEVNMTFQIYNGPDSTAISMWNETQLVTLEAGLYSVQLGSQNPITPEVFSAVPRYLGITVAGELAEMKPRILLVSVPYAFVSEVASRSAVTDSLSPAALQQISNEVLSIISTTAAAVPDPIKVNPPSGDGYQDIEGSLSVLAGGLNGIASADAVTGASLNWGAGVHGVSVYGHGVYGYSVNEHGVIGESKSPTGFGVYAINFAGTALQAISTSSAAVIASSENFDGIISESKYITGKALYGTATHSTGKNYGVWGQSASTKGTGVYGKSLGHGVIGLGNDTPMPLINAINKYGGFFASTSRGLGVDGSGYATVSWLGGQSLDIAEWIKISDPSIGAGDIVVIDKDNKNCVVKSSTAYSKLVAGIISTDPNYLAGNIVENNEILDKEEIEKRGYRMLALAGQVPCNVSAENGPIEIGDLLTTSNTPGYAMKVTDKMAAMGAIVGKALEPLASGKGKIMVLVTLQ